jgi:hypothetical protein
MNGNAVITENPILPVSVIIAPMQIHLCRDSVLFTATPISTEYHLLATVVHKRLTLRTQYEIHILLSLPIMTLLQHGVDIGSTAHSNHHQLPTPYK